MSNWPRLSSFVKMATSTAVLMGVSLRLRISEEGKVTLHKKIIMDNSVVATRHMVDSPVHGGGVPPHRYANPNDDHYKGNSCSDSKLV